MNLRLTAQEVIDLLNLLPLEGEGGFFRQTWMRGDAASPEATAIYYLVTPESFSALHRLGADEIFHFYAGDPCDMLHIFPDARVERVRLGSDLGVGQVPQVVVPAGTWQGMRLVPGGAWALVGTTMAPGYTPHLFELVRRDVLQGWPEQVRSVVAPFLPPGIA